MSNRRLDDYDIENARREVERLEGWREMALGDGRVPAIAFPDGWFVQVIPPFAGAMARFRVARSADAEQWVSVYLDTRDRLGYVGSPYWEVYPYGDDVFRCDMADTEALVKAIGESLEAQR